MYDTGNTQFNGWIQMAQEYLNIDYHINRLLLIATNKFKTEKEQAEALGVTTKTLYNYRKKY